MQTARARWKDHESDQQNEQHIDQRCDVDDCTGFAVADLHRLGNIDTTYQVGVPRSAADFSEALGAAKPETIIDPTRNPDHSSQTTMELAGFLGEYFIVTNPMSRSRSAGMCSC